MRVEKVTYEALYNLGDYENEKLSVTILVREGESVEAAMAIARQFCWENSQKKAKEDEANKRAYDRNVKFLNDDTIVMSDVFIMNRLEAVAKHEGISVDDVKVKYDVDAKIQKGKELAAKRSYEETLGNLISDFTSNYVFIRNYRNWVNDVAKYEKISFEEVVEKYDVNTLLELARASEKQRLKQEEEYEEYHGGEEDIETGNW